MGVCWAYHVFDKAKQDMNGSYSFLHEYTLLEYSLLMNPSFENDYFPLTEKSFGLGELNHVLHDGKQSYSYCSCQSQFTQK